MHAEIPNVIAFSSGDNPPGCDGPDPGQEQFAAAELDIPSQGPLCRADGLTEIVERYDPHEELAGAAFLIIVAFGGFVGCVVATWWTIF